MGDFVGQGWFWGRVYGYLGGEITSASWSIILIRIFEPEILYFQLIPEGLSSRK